MFRIFRALLPCALVTVVLVLSPAAAYAVPIAWQSVDVALHEDGSPLMIVSGTAPAGTALPAEGALSVPPGAVLQWAGEVLGGPLEQDPSFDPAVETSNGADVYSFTMGQGLLAQLELLVPNAVVDTPQGKIATIEWTANQDVPVVWARIRVPGSSEIVTGTIGAEVGPGPSGFVYYEREYEDVKAGDSIELSVTYVPPTGGAAAPVANRTTTPGQSNDILVPVLLLAAGLGIGLMLYLGRRKPSSSVVPEDSPEAPVEHSGNPHAIPADDPHAEEPVRRPLPKGAITVGVVIVFIVVVYAAMTFGTRPDVGEDIITAQIAQVDECTSSTYALDVPEDATLESVANELFDALRMTRGIGVVNVYVDNPRVEVGYCESNNSEAAIGEVLRATGYLTPQ